MGNCSRGLWPGESRRAGLKEAGLAVAPDREIVALIAYLQRLGTDIKVAPPADPPAVATASADHRGAR